MQRRGQCDAAAGANSSTVQCMMHVEMYVGTSEGCKPVSAVQIAPKLV